MSTIDITSPEPRYEFLQDPTPLTDFLVVWIWICIGVHIALLTETLVHLTLLHLGNLPPWMPVMALRADTMFKLGTSLFTLVCFIIYLKWSYRAVKNCRGFGVSGMTLTPAGAVGFQLIPVVNLFISYVLMDELWKTGTNPRNWKELPGTFLTPLWIILRLGVGLLAFFNLDMVFLPSDSLLLSAVISFGFNGVAIAEFLTAKALVLGIHHKQLALVKMPVVVGQRSAERLKAAVFSLGLSAVTVAIMFSLHFSLTNFKIRLPEAFLAATLRKSSVNLNKTLPRTFGTRLRWDSVTDRPHRLEYKWTLLQQSPDQTIDSLLTQIRKLVVKKYQSSPSTALFRNNDVVLEYEYFDSDGKPLGSFMVGPQDLR